MHEALFTNLTACPPPAHPLCLTEPAPTASPCFPCGLPLSSAQPRTVPWLPVCARRDRPCLTEACTSDPTPAAMPSSSSAAIMHCICMRYRLVALPGFPTYAPRLHQYLQKGASPLPTFTLKPIGHAPAAETFTPTYGYCVATLAPGFAMVVVGFGPSALGWWAFFLSWAMFTCALALQMWRQQRHAGGGPASR